MQSDALKLDPGAFSPDQTLARLRHRAQNRGGRPPDVVLGFLPGGPTLQTTLQALADLWPQSLRVGCEAVTQFVSGEMTSGGSLQLFWFEQPGSRAEVIVVPGTTEAPPGGEDIARVASALRAAGAAFFLADGLRFPTQDFLRRLREAHQGGEAHLAGGLASQQEPIVAPGARVFCGTEVFPSAALLVLFHGLQMTVEIVRGWDPASPIYTVTAAAGNILYEIDGEPATAWFRRFFTVDGELAPLPAAAAPFPLIIEGPGPDRRGLYRTMFRFDDPPGAVVFWGDFEVGDRVRLGIGNDASLLATAAALPTRMAPEAALLYSCVGREAVLGALADQEVATIHLALRGATLTGFFTFGEVGPTAGGQPAFYNQTAILALLREEAP